MANCMYMIWVHSHCNPPAHSDALLDISLTLKTASSSIPAHLMVSIGWTLTLSTVIPFMMMLTGVLLVMWLHTWMTTRYSGLGKDASTPRKSVGVLLLNYHTALLERLSKAWLWSILLSSHSHRGETHLMTIYKTVNLATWLCMCHVALQIDLV